MIKIKSLLSFYGKYFSSIYKYFSTTNLNVDLGVYVTIDTPVTLFTGRRDLNIIIFDKQGMFSLALDRYIT